MRHIKISRDYEIQTDHIILARKPDLVLINKKKENCPFVDFAVPAENIRKSKEIGKMDKYLDLARELKKTLVRM